MVTTAPNAIDHDRQQLPEEMPSFLRVSRSAQSEWQSKSIRDRMRVIQSCRQSLVESPRLWAEEITDSRTRSIADSLAAEVLPLADACRFLERNTARILKDSKPLRRDRPIWGRGLSVRVRHEPRGVVLVIGAGNYPLFLAGAQMLQAIAAGNAVLVKPSIDSSQPMLRLKQAIEAAGAPAGLVQVLDESPTAAQQAIDTGVDHIVLTGSAATGRKVLAQAANTLTPCTLELSGCDAVFVLPGADLNRVASALVFGLRLNGSATCIGPRRVFVAKELIAKLNERLLKLLPTIPPTAISQSVADQAESLVNEAIAAGAKPIEEHSPKFDANAFSPIVLQSPTADIALMNADLFAPVMTMVPVTNIEQALEFDTLCSYALGASVFGPADKAQRLADRIQAGCVTVNDLVAPTADPRAPFGGWKESGFGVTRGAEGLLEMTRIKTVVTQRSRWLPHLDPPRKGLDRLVIGLLRMSHGKTLAERWRGLKDVIASSRKRKD